MGFHVSRDCRDRHELDADLVAENGRAALPDLAAARSFAERLNTTRPPQAQLLPAQLNALALLNELARTALAAYRETHAPGLLQDVLSHLTTALDSPAVDAALLAYVNQFPVRDVYRGQITPERWLADETAGLPNRAQALEDMLLLSLVNQNPATVLLRDIFDDGALTRDTAYAGIITQFETFLEDQPKTDDGLSLIQLLKLPMREAPASLLDQLQHASEHWRPLIARSRAGARLLDALSLRTLSATDFLREEDTYIFNQHAAQRTWQPPTEARAMPPQFAPGRTLAADQTQPGDGGAAGIITSEPEPEAFTIDREWMPRLVLIAKSAYVWLDQLSKKHQRAITRLDQIPDGELDQLQRWGITGLWLIGLWERSIASQSIKRIMGNADAVASAYSLHGYEIADDLGGWPALHNLRERAWARGIRLASDMVPNHMGIDSQWISDHPDWFLQGDQSPYPNYTFNGPNLSRDARVSVHIEDHYFDRSDAAVVFKLHDHRDHRDRYIYHGNDGTSTPWNDTAQLNYLAPEVREAVIQTILHVARNFPIIRFDAAMTLAKRHIQRLWFPQPGQGGSIPSRAAHALTRAQLDAIMPHEFWREVVDRAAVEAPDTLLLAEAFWMMEGYFVRTLGMHRVYNSAFMIMLRNEENEGYRRVIKDTLAFDPQILRRYVNFMNNPDEKTAAEQFGKGEKYFGIATMMATLPGLPMFGHGQFEGFGEKYGMEFKKALRDEQTDWGMIEHHERVIVPLLKRRHLFAEVAHFTLFDFVRDDGSTDENVFVYSNRLGDERALVIYNNCAVETQGRVHMSSEIKPQFEHDPEEGNPSARAQRRRTLAAALDVSAHAGAYVIYRNQFTGLEHLLNARSLHQNGLELQLAAHGCHVLLDLRMVQDNADGDYGALAAQLAGAGVESIDRALKQLRIEHDEVSDDAQTSSADLSSLSSQFDLVVHATHEAGIKLGGIGAVLDGLLGADSYNAGVKRSICVGPMHTQNAIEMERLFAQKNGISFFHYFADRGMVSCAEPLRNRLSEIERDHGVRICYATRTFGSNAAHEVLMLDVSDMPAGRAAAFKFGAWQRFGIDSGRFERNPEFDEYMKLAEPAWQALQAVIQLGVGASSEPVRKCVVAHEFMGLPLFYAAELNAPGQWRSAYVAHEVPAARAIVEMSSGHDTRFYNAMRIAAADGLSIDEVFGDQTSYFKHAMLKTAVQCNRVLAVSDVTAEELRFVDRRLRRKGVQLAYNGVPARKITLAEKRVSMRKLDAAMHDLAGFQPDFIFTHVARLVASKAFWRDIAVMRALDAQLLARNETAVLVLVATASAAGRSPADAQSMARAYGWPTYHRAGWPDLVDGEVSLWRAITGFNASARASRIVLVNQFGFDSKALGNSIPEGVTFNDLRIGTDLEFGQSIYEPFGIAQLEPLTYGALCVISDSCGCKAVSAMAPDLPATNVIVGDYSRLPYMVDLHGALATGQRERDEVERNVAATVAQQIAERLPRSDAERTTLIENGHALAAALSWENVARKQFLPAIS